MRDFQPFQYIKKYAGIIAVFFVLLTAAVYFVLSSLQTYTASVVIDYKYNGAENGQAPDGSSLDISEIYSSSIISQALDNLGLNQSYYPIDVVKSNITVRQIEDETVSAVNAALSEDGEVPNLQPTEYLISYTVGSNESGYVARSILDELLDVYFSQFSQKYLNTTSVTNSISNVNQGVYDYIEQVEIMESALDQAITNLEARIEWDNGFYASSTGQSFSDLKDDFELIRETKISPLYAYILRHQVTKDKETLIEKYNQRVETYSRQQENNKARISEVEGILTAYVEKLRASNNTAQSQASETDGTLYKNSNVIGDVEDSYEAADQTTEYEQLLKNWIAISDEYNDSLIEEAYCQYVIDCFSGNTEAILNYQQTVSQFTNDSGTDVVVGGEGELVQADAIQSEISSDVYIEDTVPCTQADIEYVEQQIHDVVNELNRLYEITAKTDEEFNECLGADYIQILSSNHLDVGMNVGLYTAIGAVLFLILGCGGVIVLGRAGDIIDYVAFTDHQLHLPNRIACDRYIEKYSQKILPIGFGCLFVQITNQGEINRRLGRKNGDQILAYFASSLKSVFGIQDGGFIGYNGSGQFLIFVKKCTESELADMQSHLNTIMDSRCTEMKALLQYTVGTAVSADSNSARLRSLIGMAAKNKKLYEAGVAREE